MILKNMKRLFSLFLVVILIISMAGCGKQSLYNKYIAASEKLNKLDAIDATIEMTLDLETNGMTLNIPVNYNMKIIRENDEITQMGMDINMSMFGTDFVMNLYYANGNMYINTNGTKVKTVIDYDKLIEQYNPESFKPIELSEDILKEASSVTKDGETTISVVFDGAILKDQMSELIGSYTEMPGTIKDALTDATLSDVTASFKIDKNGYLSYSALLFDVSTDVSIQEGAEPSSMNMSIDMKITMNNPGETVTIEIPTDLDEYVEADTGSYLS